MNRLSFRLWNFDEISVSARTAFQIYVNSQRSEAIRRRRGTKSLALSNDGLRDSNSAAAKRLKLSNELTKARSQIAECERKLLAAREHYRRLANEEQATPPSSLPPATARVGSIHVILDGKAVTIPITDIIYMSDILDRMITNGSQLSPSSVSGSYQRERFGKYEYFLPLGVKVIPLNKWRRYEESHQCMKSLYKRMSSCKCTFSAKALLYFATGFHSNSGGSDTSALNLVACSFRALFHDMGIPEERISNLMIARALPSNQAAQ